MTLHDKLQVAYKDELYNMCFCVSVNNAYHDLDQIVNIAHEVIDAEIEKERYKEGDGVGLEDALDYKRALKELDNRLYRRRSELKKRKTNPNIRHNLEEIIRLLAVELVHDPDWAFDELINLVVKK